MTNKRTYIYLFSFYLTVLAWIILNKIASIPFFSTCILKRLLNIPCPSCGTTRSVLAIMKTNYKEAFLLNPLGYFVVLTLIIVPFMVIYDIIYNNNLLIYIHSKIIIFFKNKFIKIAFVVLIAVNWTWNIYKQL